MTNNFKLGCNFDTALITQILKLNDEHDNSKITEFYGSERRLAWLAARPDFRLPDIYQQDFERFISRCNLNNIIFNYTLNTIYPGSKRECLDKEEEIEATLNYFGNIGISRITVASPFVLELVRKYDKDIEIEVSTILHVDTVTQIKYLKDKYNIKKVCNNLMKNRSIKFLENAAEYCNKNDIQLELMVNEFCGVGGDGYATHCVLRDSCYLCHASNVTKEDALLFDNYPMGHCMDARNSDQLNWLRVRWIRPEDIKLYNDIGINNFKITGRTGTTEYIVKVAKAYVEQKWDGNLLDLWKPLETIYSDQKESDFQQKYSIDNKKLDGFVNHWFENKDLECSNELCGTTCVYCKNFFDKNIK
jgi:collagenase-like PrtC family protease